MGMIIMNGKEYTSSPKDGFPPIIYSDKEREIGVWRDGKPLYQKTINIQNPSHDSNWHDIAHGISNPDIFANINGVAYWVVNANTIAHVPIPSRDETNSVNYGVLIRIVGSNLQYAITGYSSTTFSKMSVTLQYTKTTDVPGSGKYTTYGGLTHHWSNTEQVIGTYINGKPVYERSWIFPSEIIINPSSWTSLGIPNTNIDLIVNVIGTSEWGISRIFSVSSKVDNTNLVALCTRNGNDSLKYLTLQYTKTTD